MHIHTGFCHNELPALIAFIESFPALAAYVKFKYLTRKAK